MRRSAVLAAVLAFHLALLGLLLVPPGPKPRHAVRRLDRPRDAITVRLITSPSWSVVDVAARRFLPGMHPSRRPAAPIAGATHGIPHAAPVAPTAIVAPDASPVPRRGTPVYIPGGHSFAERLRGAETDLAPRLPGSAIALAPGVHMVDPRSQGLAGVVRFIGGLGGASDAACIELDALGRLTDEERREQHVSRRYMERLANAHRCAPRRPRLPHPGRP